MDVADEFENLFGFLGEAHNKAHRMIEDVESVMEEASPSITKRSLELGILAGVLVDSILEDREDKHNDVTNSIVTVYLLGFLDGKRKGEEVGRSTSSVD